MTSKSLVTPLFRLITARGYAQAAPAGVSYKLECGALPNSILVAANDNGSPVTQVTVAFKAGSRFEPTTELGLTHVLRSSSGLSTKNSSGFLIARKLAQIGANVTTSGDRELVYYSLEVHCKYLDSALDHLSDLISNQEFRPWELTDNEARLKYDIAALSPQVRAVDLLHRVAYRRTLGNSLFIAPKKIGKISTESLQHFTNKNLCPTRCAISVVGGNTDVAKYIGQQLTLGQGGDGKSDASSYYGGEARKEIGGDLAHVALAYQGAPAGTPQSLALAIAAKALGNGPMIKWGNDNSPLNKAIGNIGPFAAAGFNVSYSDNGLYGLVLSVPKDEAKTAVCAAASALKTPQCITGPQIQAGKNQLILQVLSESESGSSYSESLTTQLLYSGTVRNTSDLVSAIQQVPESDVYQAISKAVCTKLSMGAVGNLAFVPYVDEV